MILAEEKRTNRLTAGLVSSANRLFVLIGSLVSFGFLHAAPDVGVTRIIAPPTTICSAATIVPACSVYNFDDSIPDYNVRIRIGNSYDTTATVTGHIPHTYRVVSFPTWVAGSSGTSSVSCSTQLAGDSVPGNDRCARPTYVWSWPFGQVYIKATVTGSVNGQPVRATGSGRLDTTGAWPGCFYAYYDTMPAWYHPFVTPLPGTMEPESTALNLWQLFGGHLNGQLSYCCPGDTDTLNRVIRMSRVADTVVIRDSLFGQIPDPDDPPGNMPYAMHWTQQDSAIHEVGTIILVRSNGETLNVNVSGTYLGARRTLLFPEVNKTYFPFSTFANKLLSISLWGRTTAEDNGRQIEIWGTVRGRVNGEALSGRVWAMADTTGSADGYVYEYFDSLSAQVPPFVLTWFDEADGPEAIGFAVRSPRVFNLWSLSEGNFDLTRTGTFSANPSETLTGLQSVRRVGNRLFNSMQVSGNYTGAQDLVALKSYTARWSQADSTTVNEQGRGSILRSSGDSVVCTFTSVFEHLARPLNFDQTLDATYPTSRAANGFFALEVAGRFDSATTAVDEPSARGRPSTLDLRVSPNPATGTATISYILPAPGPCCLGLYDVSGKLVATLASGYARAGNAGLKLRTSNLPKGIYVLRLESNGMARATKLIVE